MLITGIFFLDMVVSNSYYMDWFYGTFLCKQYAITQLNRLEDSIQERWIRKKHENFNISMYLYIVFFSLSWYFSHQVNLVSVCMWKWHLFLNLTFEGRWFDDLNQPIYSAWVMC